MSESELLRRLIAREDLAREEVAELFGRFMDGAVPEALIGALLAALAAKGETPEQVEASLRGAHSRLSFRIDAVLPVLGVATP